MSVRRNESGAAMALALAFLSLFGLLIGSILSASETGLLSSRALTGQGHEMAAADGAIEGAINRTRGDLDVGVEGYDETCFSPPAVNGVVATVDCEGQAGSGIGGEDGEGPVPDFALWGLSDGTSGEHGISTSRSGDTLDVTGDVFSGASIESSAGTLAVDGEVHAVGDCTGSITTTAPPKKCANTGGGADTAAGADPEWPADADTQPTPRNAPACPAGWLVQFEPGRYIDAGDFTALMEDCDDRVFHFTPGVYLFRFGNNDPIWTIDDADVTIVGGTPLGWDPAAPTKPALSMPGACDPDADGVQFIFARRSQWRVDAGAVELCATPHEDSQRITIYGANAASPTFTKQNGCASEQAYPADGCAFLRVEGEGTTFVSHGTLYAPRGAVHLDVDEDATVQFGRGVVARTILIDADPLWSQASPLVSVPEQDEPSPAADREVLFTALIDGVARIRAVVVFEDGGGDTPGAVVRIESWSVL